MPRASQVSGPRHHVSSLEFCKQLPFRWPLCGEGVFWSPLAMQEVVVRVQNCTDLTPEPGLTHQRETRGKAPSQGSYD